ncbi:VOC family protein [Micromonospora sp. WMMD882]|uniref:VOC family protein n=1 Tax=Micromonospora sp. WMMD882 TaxID=3015151 RepID=UPI00248AACC9|nr:VOC family protein [Micromonospora sp. WMMD882]WBB81890.1 VOC family protein [Micromonospora sp. WMMD882]
MTTFYHICFVVPDIKQAMADLSRSVGVEWGEVRDDAIGPWEYQMAFSQTGSPYFELIQGPAGSPWDSTLGARCDHIGFWTRSVEESSRRLTEQGMPQEFSGCPFGRPYTYHRVESLGVRLEMMDVSRQPMFLASWNPNGQVMPAFDA